MTPFKHFALGLTAAAGLTAMPAAAAQAQTPASPETQATPQAAVQVVVIEQLMADGPDQLNAFRKATEELKREFGPKIQEFDISLSKLREAQRAAEASPPGSAQQKEAAELSARLLRNLDIDRGWLGTAINRRQAELFDPIIAQIQSKMQAFTDELGTGPVYLVSAEQLNGQPPSAIRNVTSAFASWMKRQP